MTHFWKCVVSGIRKFFESLSRILLSGSSQGSICAQNSIEDVQGTKIGALHLNVPV